MAEYQCAIDTFQNPSYVGIDPLRYFGQVSSVTFSQTAPVHFEPLNNIPEQLRVPRARPRRRDVDPVAGQGSAIERDGGDDPIGRAARVPAYPGDDHLPKGSLELGPARGEPRAGRGRGRAALRARPAARTPRLAGRHHDGRSRWLDAGSVRRRAGTRAPIHPRPDPPRGRDLPHSQR